MSTQFLNYFQKIFLISVFDVKIEIWAAKNLEIPPAAYPKLNPVENIPDTIRLGMNEWRIIELVLLGFFESGGDGGLADSVADRGRRTAKQNLQQPGILFQSGKESRPLVRVLFSQGIGQAQADC